MGERGAGSGVREEGNRVPSLAPRIPLLASRVPPLASRVPPLASRVPPLAPRAPSLAPRAPPLAPRAPPLASRAPPLAPRVPLPPNLVLRDFPRFHEAFGHVAAGLDEEGAGAHGHVANLEGEQFLGGLELPLILGQPLGRSEIDERLQRVLDDGFGEAARGVMGAGAASVAARGDVEAVLGTDHGTTERVLAQQG